MSIGNFDGLHRGHARIIETMKAVRDASKSQRLAVVTFEPHPLTVLRPDLAPPRLTPPLVKRSLLEAAGVDDYVILPPTRDDITPTWRRRSFGASLKRTCGSHILSKGPRSTLAPREVGASAGPGQKAFLLVKLQVVDPVQIALLDLQIAPVSSSLIRWLLGHGRTRDAAICLGRAYTLEGTVVKGRQRGRTIGIPTINLDCGDQLIPADGVYVGKCNVDRVSKMAAVSIGNAPTFKNAKWQIEAHLLHFSGDLYGRTMQVEMIDWLREQRKYSSIDELKEQIHRDIAMCRQRADLDPARMIAAVA